MELDETETRYFERNGGPSRGKLYFLQSIDPKGEITLKDLNGRLLKLNRGQLDNLFDPVDDGEGSEAFAGSFPAPIDSKHGREIAKAKGIIRHEQR